MDVLVEMPKAEAEVLSSRLGNLSIAAKEALAARGYEEDALSLEQVRRFMGFDNRWDAEALLKKYRVWPGNTLADLEVDRATLRNLATDADLPAGPR